MVGDVQSYKSAGITKRRYLELELGMTQIPVARHRTALVPAAEQFDLTTNGLAKASGVSYSFTYQCAKADRIEHLVASNGVFLFRRSSVYELQRLRDEGLSRRGIRKPATSTAGAAI